MGDLKRIWLASLLAAAPDGQAIFLHGTMGGAAPCAACHGMQGQGRGMDAPRLAGMTTGAVEAALARLATGGGVMQLVASRLTQDQRVAVASYIATLPTH